MDFFLQKWGVCVTSPISPPQIDTKITPPPQPATPACKGARCGDGAGSPHPHRPHPGHTGRGTLAARSRRRAAGRGTAPDTRRPSQRWQATPPRDGPPPPPRHAAPTGHAGQGDSVGPPHQHTRARSTWVADPNSPPRRRAVGGGTAPDLRRPSQWWKAPPRARPSATPTGSNAGPQGHTLWGRCWVPTLHRPHSGHTGRVTPTAHSRGRAAGGGTAPDTRHPSQRLKAPPPGTPFRHPHREQRRPARAHAVAPVLNPPPRTDRTRDTRVAEPRPPAAGGRAAGRGTAPDTRRPSQRWQATPPGDGPPTPLRHAAPTGHAGEGDGVGPPHRNARDHSMWLADPNSPPSGRAVREGERLTTDAPHNNGRHPPGNALPPPPQRATLARKGARCGAGAGSHARTNRTRDTRVAVPRPPTPECGRPGEGQRRTPGAPHKRGRRPPPGTAPHHPNGTQPPQSMQAKGTVLRPHTHTPAPTARGWQTRTARRVGGQSAEGERLTSDAPRNGGRHPPRGCPSACPTASKAGPQGRTLWGRCWVPTPAPTAPGTHGSRNPGCPPQRTGGRGRNSA